MIHKQGLYKYALLVLLLICSILLGVVVSLLAGQQPMDTQDFTMAAQNARKSVVGIEAKGKEVVRSGYYYDFFRNRFFRRDYREFVEDFENMGSGMIIDSTGYVLTSYHVVEAARDLTVSFSDGNRYAAEVVGLDSLSDLAVVRIADTTRRFQPVSFADSDRLRVGQWAFAMGNPFLNFFRNSDPTVTAGVVSALHRNFRSSSGAIYQNMIQTDAAINPGNSGGPLMDHNGRVIGVNAFIFTGSEESPQAGSIGIGFAIPANLAQRVAQELITHQERRKAYTGIVLYDVPAPGFYHEPGVYVQYADPLGPAAEAGIRMGDRITAVNNRRIHAPHDLTGILVPFFPGDTISISVVREGERRNFPVVLGTR
ncbi:S1C family serine protease [Chitinivibrio alkaliphilus]|uniref:Periplasmic serine protease, Do/DeqQ family n=1 Tax=Chitinivibrio alkaliphilus ACht1 TaxID=1313304 RepID=U7DBI6_9BACT|nr:trypsin-like peptidase domain-containing protein [Chitinivibrio alkaliphilus]ERP31790.1 periplasmic serine protease, Do/DeqQ family [Chitinivibrio alkaliphilus ACht1]